MLYNDIKCKTNYGQAIGILMLNTVLQRVPGDIGNATTFPFPVAYRIVKEASPKRVAMDADPALVEAFVKAGLELERECGVRAITTSCGFCAVFQKEIAAGLNVPFFSSSLLQAKLVYDFLKPDQIVGIITNQADYLGEPHFRGVGIENVPKVVYGMDDTWLGRAFLEKKEVIDQEQIRRDIVARAQLMVEEHPEVGAIVLECTNMPPYAKAIQEAVGLPVFDIVSLVNYVHGGVVAREYHGYF